MLPAPKVAGTIRSKNPLKGAVEVLPERLYFAALRAPPPSHNILASTPRKQKKADGTSEKKQIHFFNMDNELVYWNFFLDFGPLNMGQFTRFAYKLHDKMRKFPVVCFYSSTIPAKRANAIFLICAWQVVHLQRTPRQAYRGFDAVVADMQDDNSSMPPVSQSQGSLTIGPLPPFHDASPVQCTYELTVLDCLEGLQKAVEVGFYSKDAFDVDEYEYFEQVENGDLNWLAKDKILAFAGPSFERNVSPEGYCTLAPADYIPYFKKKQVDLVVRLNKKMYHEEDFVNAGIRHMDAFFIDGSCPPMKILRQVLDGFESVPEGKAFAVHCKAGLGRTGTCVGAYMMKHYRFTAAEAIGWMRICRPGCVIGPQQHFLRQIESKMWQEGNVMRGPVHQPTPMDEPMSPVRHDDHEAVIGREGQAAALLSARGRRGVGTKTSIVSHPPVTPEQKQKDTPVAVTPDAKGINSSIHTRTVMQSITTPTRNELHRSDPYSRSQKIVGDWGLEFDDNDYACWLSPGATAVGLRGEPALRLHCCSDNDDDDDDDYDVDSPRTTPSASVTAYLNSILVSPCQDDRLNTQSNNIPTTRVVSSPPLFGSSTKMG